MAHQYPSKQLNNFQLLPRFLQFHAKAKTRYKAHSPFVFDFTENVLEDDRHYYAFSELEALRQLLLTNQTGVELKHVEIARTKESTIAHLAKNTEISQRAAQTLFRIVQFYKPKHILELGTSLGISTLYLSRAALNAEVLTLENEVELAHLAAHNFQVMKGENIALLEGAFSDILPQALQEMPQLDFVFFNGKRPQNHLFGDFEKCLQHAHEGSFFVFNNIHGSAEMEAVWKKVKAHPKVKLSLDLFYLGVVFFRNAHLEKEDYSLIKWSWKPWGIGFTDFF